MLRMAILFLVIAIIAGLMGFSTIEGTAAFMAQIAFFVFLVLFLGSLIMGLMTGGDRGRIP